MTFFIPAISYGAFPKKESFWSRIGSSIENILSFGRHRNKEKVATPDINTVGNSYPNTFGGFGTFGTFDTMSENKTNEVEKLKKEVTDLKKQVSNNKQKTVPASVNITPEVAKPKTFTLPSGAVIDDNGNLITPAPQPYSASPIAPSQQAIENTLWKMLKEQCYSTYSSRAQIQANIDKINNNQTQKARERQELITKIEREISAMENATDSLTNARKMLGTQDKFVADMREIKYRELASFDLYWDTLHTVIGSTNFNQSREEMCN